jgi:hypothetical protein
MTTLVNSLAQVGETIQEESRGKWDSLVEPQELTLVQGRVVSPRLYRYEYPTGLEMTPWATAQLCHFLGMPTRYFRKCPVVLQDSQFNHWISQLAEEKAQADTRAGKAERWLLRAKGEALRGVLTERYTRLDNLELFAAISPALSSEYAVDWFALSDESLHLRFYDARLYRDALPGDRLMAGVHVSNSEVGKRSVTVDSLVYRLICTNGLIRKIEGQSLLHQRHISLSRPEFALTVQTAVRQALAQSALYLERLSAAVAHPLPQMERLLHKLVLDWGLTQATEEVVKAAILTEPPSQQETLYGLINGLTGAARSLSPDERYTLETRAGELLEKPALVGSSSRLLSPFGDHPGALTPGRTLKDPALSLFG